MSLRGSALGMRQRPTSRAGVPLDPHQKALRSAKAKASVARGHAFQVEAADFLRRALPPESGVPWTTFPAGGGGARRGAKLKRAGLKRGWTDAELIGTELHHFGVFHGLEYKFGQGALSKEQKAMHALIRAAGGKIAVVQTVLEISAALEEWGFPIRSRAVPFGAGYRLIPVR